MRNKLKSIVKCSYVVIEPQYSGKLVFTSPPIDFPVNETVRVEGNYVKAYCVDKTGAKVFREAYLTLTWSNETAAATKENIWKDRTVG